MTIGELMSQMALLGYDGLETDQHAEAIANSYRLAGIIDGDDLAIAWERCQASWKKNKAPRPEEFKKFMPEKLLDAPRKFHMDFRAYQEELADTHDRSWTYIIEKYGNPNAVGPMRGDTQLSAKFADENKWLDRFYPLDKCAKYVRLKLARDEGFGGREDVEAAKAAIFPTDEQVERARAEGVVA